jgi:hypothetical protein
MSRVVAIKVLSAHLAADLAPVTRFEREARAVAPLSHPNILGAAARVPPVEFGLWNSVDADEAPAIMGAALSPGPPGIDRIEGRV